MEIEHSKTQFETKKANSYEQSKNVYKYVLSNIDTNMIDWLLLSVRPASQQ